jgi:hypothetical protein
MMPASRGWMDLHYCWRLAADCTLNRSRVSALVKKVSLSAGVGGVATHRNPRDVSGRSMT